MQVQYQQMFRRSALPVATYAELVRLLYASIMPMTTIGLATAGIAGLIAAKTSDPFLMILWIIAALVTLCRLGIVFAYRRQKAPADIGVWERRYGAGSFVFSLVLGLVGARAFVLDDPTIHMLATALLFAYSSGLIMRLCPRPAICVGTLLLAAVPIIVAILARGETTHFALAGLLAIMIVGGLETAFHMYRNMVSYIGTRQKFEQLATRDALTGLPNRLMLEEAILAGLTRSAAGGTMLAVHFLDLDKFKAANDRYGHPVGDVVLKEVAARLLSVLRDTDMVARLGGDEFVVVQQQIKGRDEAEMLGRRIIKVLTAPYQHAGKDISIGASVGIAMAPLDGEEAHQLMAAADMALYASKGAGRGLVSFYRKPAGADVPVAI